MHQQLQHHDELGDIERSHAAVVSGGVLLLLLLLLSLLLLFPLFFLGLQSTLYGFANGPEEHHEVLVTSESREGQSGAIGRGH